MNDFSGRFGLLALAIASVSGCDQPRQRSLVGDWAAPVPEILAKETIVLWFRDLQADDVWRTQSFTVKPGGVVVFEAGREFPERIDKSRHTTDQKAVRTLSAADYQGVLSVAGELRPKKLTQEAPFTLPPGCSFIYDDISRAGLSFQSDSGGGAFIMQSGCKGAGAQAAGRRMGRMLELVRPYFLPSRYGD